MFRKLRKRLTKTKENCLILPKLFNDKKRGLPITFENLDIYLAAHRVYKQEVGGYPNIAEPSDYNEIIQCFKIFHRDPLMVECADKLGLRKYVTESLGEKYLPKLYLQSDSLKEIPLEKLPDSFVIKTNHDSGSVFLVPDKQKIDSARICARINRSLKKSYGRRGGEWVYEFIAPQCFIEEYLGKTDDSPPPDYKFHCFHGRFEWLQYIYDRGPSTKETIISRDGKDARIHFDHNMQPGDNFFMPNQWLEMIAIAEKLAKPFPYARIDLYTANDSIYVGEITFFPLMGCYLGEGQKILGQGIQFAPSHCTIK